MTLVEIVNAPELTDIVGSAPDTKQEEIALQLLSVARRLTGTDCHDSCETQVRLEQIKDDLPRILRELVRIARVLADNERAEVPTVADIQRAWNITPTPKLVRKVTTSEHLENLDKIHMLSLLNDLLPRQEAAVRKIYSDLLREFSYDSCPEMSDEDLRAEVTRRCQEKVREWQRLNLSKEEQWYEGRKRKGDIPTRVEFLKRVGLAKAPLECIERRDGESFYSLASIDSKCSALLVVPSSDGPVIERLDKAHIVIKLSRSKLTNYTIWFRWRFQGRAGRIDRLVPLEVILPKYKVIDGDKIAVFTQEEMLSRADRKVARGINNALSFEEYQINSAAPSAVGIVKEGTKRLAAPWRAGRGSAPAGEQGFKDAIGAAYKRQGATFHEADDRRKGRLEVDVVKVNIETREDAGETDGLEKGEQ